MTERDAFIRAIAADLYDDTPRLAFADWLDEHGEHARAEFIRVQIELEPIRDQYEIPRAAELHEREKKLAQDAKWLGDAPAMPDGWEPPWKHGSGIEFRRGFPDLFRCPAKAFVQFGAAVRVAHPTIRRVVIHCLNGWGARLAACASLRGLPELELACWYFDDDVRALGASPHLSELQVLVLWMGRVDCESDDAALCRLAAEAQGWSHLRELVLFDPEGDGEQNFRRDITRVNKFAGRKLARYQRGYPELFPLAPEFVFAGAWPGRLSDGRAALVTTDRGPGGERAHHPIDFVVLTFDATGTQTNDVIRVPLPPDADAQTYLQCLKDAIGFVPGFIRVQRYEFPDGRHGPWRGHSDTWDACGYPDYEDGEGGYGFGGWIYWHIHEGYYVAGDGGSKWYNKAGSACG